MKTLLKFIFLYLPVAFAYYTFAVAILVYTGYIDDPRSFNLNDYSQVYSEVENGTKVTYHVKK